MHGSDMCGRELVDLRQENRWECLNTLFSVSEAVAYMQVCANCWGKPLNFYYWRYILLHNL